MRETWYYIIAEFRALGIRCVACGPEFWLAVTAICGLMCISMAVCCCVFGEGDRYDRR